MELGCNNGVSGFEGISAVLRTGGVRRFVSGRIPVGHVHAGGCRSDDPSPSFERIEGAERIADPEEYEPEPDETDGYDGSAASEVFFRPIPLTGPIVDDLSVFERGDPEAGEYEKIDEFDEHGAKLRRQYTSSSDSGKPKPPDGFDYSCQYVVIYKKPYFRQMPEKQNIPTIHFLSYPSARAFVEAYDAAFDVLDGQGRDNALQIHATLAGRFFGGRNTAMAELAELRGLAKREEIESDEARRLASSVADAAVKIIEPKQVSLFDERGEPTPESKLVRPSESSPVALLRPRSEMELNFEDFEAAFRLRDADPEKPNYLEFETVINGTPKLCRVPWVVAKTILIPTVRTIRIFSLWRQIHPGEYPE